jgi:hypothetical protein
MKVSSISKGRIGQLATALSNSKVNNYPEHQTLQLLLENLSGTESK